MTKELMGSGPSSRPGGTAVMARYGLRSHRWTFAAVALLGFIAPYSTGVAYAAVAGTEALRAALGRQTVAMGPQLAYLIPLPLHPETAAGYIWWKGVTWMTLVLAAWGLAAATGIIRNEEERGLTESWLSSPLGRVNLLLQRTGAFALIALAAVAITGLGTAAGVAAGRSSVGLLALVEQGSALLGICLVSFGVGLAAAQISATRRGGLMVGGLVLIACYVLDALARVNPSLAGWAVISPFHLADLTTAVVPEGQFNGAATISLYAIAVALVVIAAASFRRRDLYSAFARWPARVRGVSREPSNNPLLRFPVLRELWEQRVGLAGWVLGSMVGAGLVVSLARGAGKLLRSSPSFSGYIRAAGTSSAATAVVSSIWLSIAAMIGAAYAIASVSHWASEDSGGRLEMEIAQPWPRWKLVLERGLALTAASFAMSALGSLVVGAVAPGQGVALSAGRLVVASLLLVLLTLTFGSLGALIIARFPRAAVPGLAFVALLSFYVPLLAPLFRWPAWVLNVSLFHLYGTPLTSGLYWTGIGIMAVIVVVGFTIAVVAMRVRDVGS